MHTLLLVEDNAHILNTNREFLEGEGYTVHAASTLAQAQEILKSNDVDLIVLDIMLPDGMGTDFCAELRKDTQVPVLYLTCLEEDDFLVEALKAGGDEYITKPYRLTALSARIMALLRRVRVERSSAEVFNVGSLTIDCAKRAVYSNGKNLLLKPKEFDLLLLFVRDIDRCFTAGELYVKIWGSAAIDTRTVLVHISSLRKKLENTQFRIITQKRKYYSLANSGDAAKPLKTSLRDIPPDNVRP